MLKSKQVVIRDVHAKKTVKLYKLKHFLQFQRIPKILIFFLALRQFCGNVVKHLRWPFDHKSFYIKILNSILISCLGTGNHFRSFFICVKSTNQGSLRHWNRFPSRKRLWKWRMFRFRKARTIVINTFNTHTFIWHWCTLTDFPGNCLLKGFGLYFYLLLIFKNRCLNRNKMFVGPYKCRKWCQRLHANVYKFLSTSSFDTFRWRSIELNFKDFRFFNLVFKKKLNSYHDNKYMVEEYIQTFLYMLAIKKVAAL